MGGGGKGGSTQSSGSQWGVSNTNIPDWLQAAGQGAVQQAQALSQQPYQAYTGQIVADPTAMQNQAYAAVQAMQGGANPALQASQQTYQGLLGQAAPITADQIQQFGNSLYGNYQNQVMNPAQGLLSGYLGNASPATAQQVGSNAMTLMNPYEAAVINPALQAGQQQFDLARQSIAGQAQNVGAFGGSRQGVTEGVAQSQAALGTGQAIGNLLNQGWQSSLTPAYNLASQQSQQGYNAANLLAQMGQSGYSAAQQQAGTAAQLNQAQGMTAAQMLPQEALAQQAQAQREAGLLQTAGDAQWQEQQKQLNAQLGQYYEAQNYPYQSLDTLLSAVGAVPYGTSTVGYGMNNQKQTTTPGLMDQITGAIGTGAKIASTAAMFL